MENITTQLKITREFYAPRVLVFKAFTTKEALAQWWGPKGSDIFVKELNFNPGGVFHYSMTNEHGVMWGKFQYREIVEPERIVFVNSFADEDGNIIRAPFFDGGWPLEILNTLTLTEQNGKTLLTIIGGPINATAEEHTLFDSIQSSMQEGFGGTFDKLDIYLASQGN
jgi:uncharacterized protein YndB with AHSA1/START domain